MHKITARTATVYPKEGERYLTLEVVSHYDNKQVTDQYVMDKDELLKLAKSIIANHTPYSFEQLTEVLG